jgi:hypothetical protein
LHGSRHSFFLGETVFPVEKSAAGDFAPDASNAGLITRDEATFARQDHPAQAESKPQVRHAGDCWKALGKRGSI